MGTRGTISCAPVLTRPAPLPTAAPWPLRRRDALPAGRGGRAAHGQRVAPTAQRSNRRRFFGA